MYENIMQPIYCGGIDLKINKAPKTLFDEVFAFRMKNRGKEGIKEQEKQKFKLSLEDQTLFDHLETLNSSKDLIKGFWQSFEVTASQPQSRESARMVAISRKVFMFGGFAREPFNDTRVLLDYEDKYVC